MEKVDSRLIQSVILLDRQYALTEHLIANQSHILKDFEQAIQQKEQGIAHVLDVYNYVFALIDHLERYRKIALSIPKLNHKSPEYRALISAVGDVEAARHEIQHVNNQIENDYTGHVLGSIFWISGNKQYMAAFHDVGRERSAPGPIFDTQTGKFVHDFCYVYNEKYYDLQKAISGVKVFNQHINSRIKIQINGKDYNIKDHFSAMCAEFQFMPIPPASE
jgi:hypothetical protein